MINSSHLKRLKTYLTPELSQRLRTDVNINDARAILTHLTIVRYTLSTYLPRYLVDLITKHPLPGRVSGGFRYGSVMFADISGFTAMSEKLAALGRQGTEEIVNIINDYFDAMLDISAGYNGDLLKFGGDALLVFFEGKDGAQRAIAAGQTMLTRTKAHFNQLQTSQGAFSLQMSIGIGTGPILLASLGSDEKMEYTVMGPALVNMAQAEDRASAGQLLVDRATRDAAQCLASFKPASDDFWLLEMLLQDVPHQSNLSEELEPPIFVSEDDMAEVWQQCLTHVTIIEALKPYLPAEILTRIIIEPQQPALPGYHRPVTVLFNNFYGFDELIETLGPAHQDIITTILNIHFLAMSDIITRYGGVVNKVDSYATGHRIMALFGALQAHEDDPERAVRAALEMDQALSQVNRRTQAILASISGFELNSDEPPLKQRIGINNGFVFAGNVGSAARREYSVMGDEVNLAARLMGAAGEDEILISQNLARHLGAEFTLYESRPLNLKGKSKSVPSFRVGGLKEQSLSWTNAATGPLVGRDEELKRGRAAVDRARTGRGCLLIISGPAGIGKTRLAEEVILSGRRLGMDLLAGACLSYSKTMAYYPWNNLLRAYFDLQPAADPQILIEVIQKKLDALEEGIWAPIVGEVMGLEVTDNALTSTLDAKLRRQRLFDLTLKLLQTRAQGTPLMILIEDAHWADSASLDLIEYVARNITNYPIIFILSYRPEEEMPDWATYPQAIELSLGDLPDEACLKIVQKMIGPADLPASLRNLILSKGGGNPFFTEEVVQALISTGALWQDPLGAWQARQNVESIDLPDSIHGIIISRVDHLSPNDRRILEIGSVIGNVFASRIVDRVDRHQYSVDQLQQRLGYLSRLGLTEVQSLEAGLYRFKHLTTREVIYESMAFEQRRSLHRRIADFIEREWTETNSEQTDLLAYHHFEGQVWTKAVIYNLLVARRAQREFANNTALVAYQRVLDAGANVDTDILQERLLAYEALGQVLSLLGRYDEALEHYASVRALVEAEPPSSDQARYLADLYRQTASVYEKRSEYEAAFTWLEKGIDCLTDSLPTIELARIYILGAGVYHRQGKNSEAIDWCLDSLITASEIKTREGRQVVGQASYLLGNIYTRLGDLPLAIRFCHESIRFYRQIDDVVGQSQAYINLSNAYAEQGDWEDSIATLHQSLTMKQEIGDIFGQGIIANNLAYTYLERGEWPQATELFAQSLTIWRQLGAIWPEAITLSNMAQVYIYQEDWGQAETCLRHSQTIFAEVGSEEYLPELERRWAELYLRTGKLDQAMTHTQRSIELAITKEARLEEGMSRRMLGQIQLTQGQEDLAETSLGQSLKILSELQSDHEAARTMVVLAHLLQTQQAETEAQSYLTQAIEIFEKLGAQADLTEARRLKQLLFSG